MTPAERLRAAADRLSSPTLCNTNPWDAAVVEWLRWEARTVTSTSFPFTEDILEGTPPLAVADAVLAATGGAS